MYVLMLDCIQDMRSEYEASCGLPITDDSQSLQRFCSKLEHLLQIGLRGAKLSDTVILHLFIVMGQRCNNCFWGPSLTWSKSGMLAS